MNSRKARKAFAPGQVVEIQRDTGYSPPWESATYKNAVPDMRGWHRVELPQGRGRYIDSMSGMEVTGEDPMANPRAFLTHHLIVPTRRIRAPKAAP